MEVIEEQFKMLGAKSESLTTEFTRARELIQKVADERHLIGMEGLKDQKNMHELRDEEIQKEIQTIKISEALESLVDDLKKVSESVMKQMKEETD